MKKKNLTKDQLIALLRILVNEMSDECYDNDLSEWFEDLVYENIDSAKVLYNVLNKQKTKRTKTAFGLKDCGIGKFKKLINNTIDRIDFENE